MNLNTLPKITAKPKKRIGRGHGSGKGGHTVGKGKYGQKSREKISLIFEGTKLKKSLLKRLPLLRGKGKFKSHKLKPIVVNIKYLNLFDKNEIVDIKSLAKKGIIKEEDGKKYGIKILGNGDLNIPLRVNLPCSKSAAKKIINAGGEIANVQKN